MNTLEVTVFYIENSTLDRYITLCSWKLRTGTGTGSVITAAADPETDPFALLHHDSDIKFNFLFFKQSMQFFGIFSTFCRIFSKVSNPINVSPLARVLYSEKRYKVQWPVVFTSVSVHT
jgi:hypothetical protein